MFSSDFPTNCKNDSAQICNTISSDTVTERNVHLGLKADGNNLLRVDGEA